MANIPPVLPLRKPAKAPLPAPLMINPAIKPAKSGPNKGIKPNTAIEIIPTTIAQNVLTSF